MPNVNESLYLSDYSGSTIDDAIGTTIAKEDYWDNKVDKVAGKALSTNDFTNTDKSNLDRLTTLLSGISDVTTTIQNNNTSVPTGKAILDAVSDLGGGDMMRRSYDTTNTGNKVDTAINAENAEALGGVVKAIKANGSGNVTDGDYFIFSKVKRNNNTAGSSNCSYLVTGAMNFATNSSADVWLVSINNYNNAFAMNVVQLAGPQNRQNSTTRPVFGYYLDGDYYYLGVHRLRYSTLTTVIEMSSNGKTVDLWPQLNNYAIYSSAPSGWTPAAVQSSNINLAFDYAEGVSSLAELTTLLDSWISAMPYYSIGFYGLKIDTAFFPFQGNNHIYFVRIMKPGSNNSILAEFYHVTTGGVGSIETIHLVKNVNGVWGEPWLNTYGKGMVKLQSTDGRNSPYSGVTTPADYINYYGRGTAASYALANTIGVSGTTNAVYQMTHIPWDTNSGGYPVQEVFGRTSANAPVVKVRTGSSDTAWSSWKTVTYWEDVTSLLNRATKVSTADSNLNISMVRGISAGTTDLTAGSSALAAGTIYLVYEE